MCRPKKDEEIHEIKLCRRFWKYRHKSCKKKRRATLSELGDLDPKNIFKGRGKDCYADVKWSFRNEESMKKTDFKPVQTTKRRNNSPGIDVYITFIEYNDGMIRHVVKGEESSDDVLRKLIKKLSAALAKAQAALDALNNARENKNSYEEILDKTSKSLEKFIEDAENNQEKNIQ